MKSPATKKCRAQAKQARKISVPGWPPTEPMHVAALRAVGNSMAPVIQDNDRVELDWGGEPKIGEFVAVRLKDGETQTGKLVSTDARRRTITIDKINPEGNPRCIRADDLFFVVRILAVWRKF